MTIPQVILVGGFLGAGKTTLLAEAAARLTRQGKRVGLVANDQASDMVDTAMLKETGANVKEVAGGCFCCRFPDRVSAMEQLVRESDADVLMAEPVGSCTDLSATVMQPLKKLHSRQFSVSPFSVLVDGHQVRVLDQLRKAAAQSEHARFPDDVLYIYEKQLEEADVIVLNKVDLLPEAELADIKASLAKRFPETQMFSISAMTGEGVDVWLDCVGQGNAAGRKITEVDYDTYAAGEAALGWLNASVALHARNEIDWKAFTAELLETMRTTLRIELAEIAHLKVYIASGGERLVGNVTSNHDAVSVRGNIDAAQRDVAMLINARVHVEPERLRAVVENALKQVARDRLEATITNLRSFSPGRPQPTHRYEAVVQHRC
jgi:G3E family GTPase